MNHQLLLKLAAVDTHLSSNSNQSKPAIQTSSVRVSGRAVAVAGRILHGVLVGGWCAYSMALCVLNRWGGGKVLCSPWSRAGNWLGGRIQVEMQWGEGGKKKKRGILFLSCRPPVYFLLSASQRRGLPAGSPRDLASLGLCEHRGWNGWGMWPVQLGACGGRRSCRRQTAGCDGYTWERKVNIWVSSMNYFQKL